MSTAQIIELAAAVVTSLNEGSFSQPFSAERVYQPTFKMDDDGLRVFVMPRGVLTALASRGSTEDTGLIQIGVLKRASESADLDALVLLVKQIADHLRFKAQAGWTWFGVEIDPLFDPENLNEKRMFLSIITVTYRRED